MVLISLENDNDFVGYMLIKSRYADFLICDSGLYRHLYEYKTK